MVAKEQILGVHFCFSVVKLKILSRLIIAQPYKFWANNLKYLLNLQDRYMHPPPGRREQQTADDYEGDDSHRHTVTGRPISLLCI